MASLEVKLPDIGEGVNEGEIVRWIVKEGDVLKHDQPMVEVMTDKATVEIPCSSDGKVTKLVAKEGDIVKVGGVLLVMETGAGVSAAAGTSAETPAKAAAAATAVSPARPAPTVTERAPQMQGGGIFPPPAGANVLATPATRRYAREMGVDLNQIKGTGPIGRITREDVAKSGSQGLGAVAAGKTQFKMPPPMASMPGAQNLEERKPFRGIRRKIAENLVRSKQTIPHFTHTDETDVTELVAWRTKMKEKAAAMGVKLTYLPFVMKALVVTAKEYPQFNCSIDDAASEVVYKNYFNVGFAADTPEGLLVPNVKNVESKSILQLAHEIQELADKARTGKLAPDDMKNGTVTITNIGSIGGISATPIINHPEVAIFGIYKIQKKPVVVGSEIKIRDMMGVTATCDHRIVDGAKAAEFLNKLNYRLSNPEALLLEMI